jgi:hypothetical protein
MQVVVSGDNDDQDEHNGHIMVMIVTRMVRFYCETPLNNLPALVIK